MVIRVGGGAFGIATAWQLSQELGTRSKYSSIRVLDRFLPPSPIAASTDINRIIRTEYADPVYMQLAVQALQAWTDPEALFRKHFHRSGWLLCGSGDDVGFVEQSEENAKLKGVHGAKFMVPDEVQSKWPVVKGPMKDWRILSDPAAGWAASSKVLVEMAQQSAGCGVGFISGNAGHVRELLYDAYNACIGVRTVDGTTYEADQVLLTTGARTACLIDMEGQLSALGHTVCYIQLAREEADRYRHIPIIADIGEAAVFAPDENNVIKIASSIFVTNFKYSPVSGVSLPGDLVERTVPAVLQNRLRGWLRQVLPELADRPWSDSKLCWDTDTPTHDFLISSHPRHKGLFVATGGSGHAFKFVPIIGRYISQLLDGAVPENLEKQWKWGSSTATSRETGGKPMFPTPALELGDLLGWQPVTAKI
ncbi:hypothetical protein LTS17_001574 [Exophiala oligosperma]